MRRNTVCPKKTNVHCYWVESDRIRFFPLRTRSVLPPRSYLPSKVLHPTELPSQPKNRGKLRQRESEVIEPTEVYRTIHREGVSRFRFFLSLVREVRLSRDESSRQTNRVESHKRVGLPVNHNWWGCLEFSSSFLVEGSLSSPGSPIWFEIFRDYKTDRDFSRVVTGFVNCLTEEGVRGLLTGLRRKFQRSQWIRDGVQ